MTIHPWLGSMAVAGLIVELVASSLGVYAILLRDRCAEPLWFAATLGAAMTLVGGFGFDIPGVSVVWAATTSLIFVALPIAMWVVARRRLGGHAGAPAVFPRWEAAAWALELPLASLLPVLPLLAIVWALVEAAGAPWLVLQCHATSDVDIEAPFLVACDGARHVVAWWWMYTLIGVGTLSIVVSLWLLWIIPPRGARWRLVGFLALFLVLEPLQGLESETDWIKAAVIWIVVVPLAAWLAFRPLPPLPAVAATGSWSRHGRRVAIAGAATLGASAIAVAVVIYLLTSPLRRLPVYSEALARVRSSESAIAQFGQPIEESSWLAGHTASVCGHDVVTMYVRFEGPRGAGLLEIAAVESHRWEFVQLALKPIPEDGDLRLSDDTGLLVLLSDAERARLDAFAADAPRRKAERTKAEAEGRDTSCMGGIVEYFLAQPAPN